MHKTKHILFHEVLHLWSIVGYTCMSLRPEHQDAQFWQLACNAYRSRPTDRLQPKTPATYIIVTHMEQGSH